MAAAARAARRESGSDGTRGGGELVREGRWPREEAKAAATRGQGSGGRGRSDIKEGFAEGKDLAVTVMSSMGEEQICALKDIGPKN
ncbi:hypothetical protein Nepgr_015246 [Nepenthes gracilis]|uniref:Translation initiation factor 5A C-terminal domain-containing protein n=1 Tax=Nepenthes gracilis TaxID=150966 RepID=A0AAD3SMG5_NEPGR|nr:hypothetical protein Nepgr_015246 [Nepenthes gracilis]